MKERNRRMKKTLSLLLCALLLALSLSACLFPGYQTDTGSTSTANDPMGEDEEVKESAEDPHIEETDSIIADLQSTSIDEVKVYDLGEPAIILTDYYDETKIVSLTVTGAEMTKLIGEYDVYDLPTVSLDFLGFDGEQLTGDYSFVFVDVEVTNLCEEKQVFNASSLGYYVVHDDGYFRGEGGCFFFFDKSEDKTPTGYGSCLMEPGETLTAVVGFFIEDGPDLSQGFIPADLIGTSPNGETEWFALTERE